MWLFNVSQNNTTLSAFQVASPKGRRKKYALTLLSPIKIMGEEKAVISLQKAST
jgi:hypothetical protein